MVDNADDSQQQAVAEPRAGQRLANARRANNISMRDIAKELHLDEVKVQALEDNRFEVLGAPVFAKGYLRKYAELLGVPIDDVLADYYRLNRAVGAPPVVGPKRERPPAELSPGRWIGGSVILVVVAAGAYWWMNRTPVPVVTAVTSNAPAESDAVPVASAELSATGAEVLPQPDALDADSDTTGGGDAEPPELSVAATTDQASPTASVSASDSELRLELRFSGDCWTEVTDGAGRRLYFGLGTDGRNINVSGVPPLRVLLGNNDNVSLLVNGEVYTVRPGERRGNTARLTLAGP
jgi:cytoskeleton protein RodZ